uniref:Uncharacterized protein n=1 Tax=Chromera velia CCMP2878 TaxID=1169474 RepID=A0A0G4HUT5_9ALVE|eukprot:Cvel_32038.t1-p1 / transcript=Cvel_32038.t1 / gene=Cvel_32038 / organism=Chromera_velia_CCMP2878 / gene_product=hypothetical protein / transcript_product=hypothetical protein / location=Cvel_scaffold4888:49-2517(+) / protein_length=303 / sequence_SO=supercontig / SO=protein_coding / is_pseudo=false
MQDWLSETVCVATSLYVLEKRNEEEGGVQASAVEWSLAVLRALSREGDAFSLPSDRLSAFQKLSGVLSDCLLFLPDSPSLFDPSFKETLEPLLTSLEHALSTVAQIVQRHPSAAEEAYAECPQLWTEVSACVVFLSCWMEPPSSSSSQLAGGETEGNSEGATMKREKDESEESARREQRIVVRAAAAALVAVGAATAHAAEENAESVLEALGGPPLLTAVWCLLESCKVKHERGSEKGRQEKTEEPESEGDDKERLRSLAASVIRLFWKAPAESAHHEKAELVAATRGSQGRGASTLEHEEIN